MLNTNNLDLILAPTKVYTVDLLQSTLYSRPLIWVGNTLSQTDCMVFMCVTFAAIGTDTLCLVHLNLFVNVPGK